MAPSAKANMARSAMMLEPGSASTKAPIKVFDRKSREPTTQSSKQVKSKGKGEQHKRMKAEAEDKKKKSFDSYANFLFKVLRQVHPELGITRQAMSSMDSMMKDLFERLAREAAVFVEHRGNGCKTITDRDFAYAVRLLIPGELGNHAAFEAAKALKRYNASCEQDHEE